MTTDATALQERIARAIRLADTGDTLPDGFAARMWDEGVTNRDKEMRLAAAVLPIISAEVQAAKAEALREMAEYAAQDLGWATGGHTSTHRVRFWLRARADEHETGARA